MMQDSSVNDQPVLGVLLSQFPRYDEAFILRELVCLAEEAPLVIFSLRMCKDRVIHAQAKPLQPKTVYAAFFFSWDVLKSQLYFLFSKPSAYLGSLGWIVSRHWKHPVVLAKTLAFFPKTVHFARIAQNRGVKLLHAFWATYPASSALIIQRLTGIAYSLSGHAHDIYTANPALAEKIQGARFVLTCTEDNRRYLASLVNGQAPDIAVSYHGVDLKKFSASTKSPQGPCRLLIVGSLFPCKGLETLIESCRLLRDLDFSFSCRLAGGGVLEKKLRALIARYRLQDHVAITGYVSQEAVAEFYKQAHLFVLPLISRIHWGIPNVLIEALATKTPVICCDLPSMKELVIHGESGWIIPEENPKALAEAVKQLWSQPDLRQRMAESGFNRVIERFSLERTGLSLRAVFSKHLSGQAE